MKKTLLRVLGLFLIHGMIVLSWGSAACANQLRDAVVKVFVTVNHMDYFRPWQSEGTQPLSGSGCILEGNRIMTNAHVVDDATFIQVRKESDPRKFTAKVEAVGHDCDLAILSVSDPEFFVGTTAVEIGTLPSLQDTVSVIGFPEGGDKISITEGVVSRIEIVPYSQSSKKLLAVQIDAAINPGNSGGPVFQDGKLVGIAMQGITMSQNIGYMIPTPILNHFLDDLKDKRYDGFPTLGIDPRETENKTLREYYKVPDAEGGVLVTRTLPFSPAHNVIHEGDVIVAVEDTPIGVDGTFEFRPHERLTLSHLISSKHVGDIIMVKLIRDGQVRTEKIKLTPFTNLVPYPNSFQKPPYYIYGGLVFSVLSADLLKSWGQNWWERAPIGFLNYLLGSGSLNSKEKKEIVVLLDVLPDDINVGYFEHNHVIIERVNGREFTSFGDFVKLVETNTSKYCIFETEQKIPLVIDTTNINQVTRSILERNSIPAQYSEDVKKWLGK